MSTVSPITVSQSLTTSLVATDRTAEANGYEVHDVFIAWTPGTAANVLTYTVEFRHNVGANGPWTQEMTWDGTASGGTQTSTRTLHQYQHTAADTDEVGLLLNIQGGAHQIRVKLSESEAGSSTKGTASVVVFSRKH